MTRSANSFWARSAALEALPGSGDLVAAFENRRDGCRVLEHRNVGGGVAVDDHDVGVLAWFERADHARRAGSGTAVARCSQQRFGRGHREQVDEVLKVFGIAAVWGDQ